MGNNNWIFKGAVVEGEPFFIDEINIWDYNWENTHEDLIVKDPLYNESHRLIIYIIRVDERIIKFAAGEFSNMIFGIYEEQ